MKERIGTYQDSIATLKLDERTLKENTLILGETGAGKTHLANKIRKYVIDCDVPTIYFDFLNPDPDRVEERFKEGAHFHYMRFDESEAFEKAVDEAIEARLDIYMAVDPRYFSGKREVTSQLSKIIQKKGFLENYYYFMQIIAKTEGFFLHFEDFFLYILDIIYSKKYGLTFVSQPDEIFENTRIKLLFSFLYLGRCTGVSYYNTAILKNIAPHNFLHQERLNYKTLLFSPIKTDLVCIDTEENPNPVC